MKMDFNRYPDSASNYFIYFGIHFISTGRISTETFSTINEIFSETPSVAAVTNLWVGPPLFA